MEMFKKFIYPSDTLFEGKLIQNSMDGPSVNLKFYNDVPKYRNEKELLRLQNSGIVVYIVHREPLRVV